MATALTAGTARAPNCRRTSNTLTPIVYFPNRPRRSSEASEPAVQSSEGTDVCQGLIASDETRPLPDRLTWWRLAGSAQRCADGFRANPDATRQAHFFGDTKARA